MQIMVRGENMRTYRIDRQAVEDGANARIELPNGINDRTHLRINYVYLSNPRASYLNLPNRNRRNSTYVRE